MAAQQFDHGKYRYIPSRPVRFNGTLGRLWERRELRQGCWVFCGRTFHHARATRSDIRF
jgi:hypothetical protein